MYEIKYNEIEKAIYFDFDGTEIVLMNEDDFEMKYEEVNTEVIDKELERYRTFINIIKNITESNVTKDISDKYNEISRVITYIEELNASGNLVLESAGTIRLEQLGDYSNIGGWLFTGIATINDINNGENLIQALSSQIGAMYAGNYAAAALIAAGAAAGVSGVGVILGAVAVGTVAGMTVDKLIDVFINSNGEREEFLNKINGIEEIEFIIDGNPITISVDSNSESTYKGNIETISKLWELGSDNIDGFEAIYDDYTFKYDKSNEAIIVDELGDLILNGEDAILKFLDSFPDLLSESVVLTDGIKEYKLERNDFLSGLVGKAFSLEELIAINPSLEGKRFEWNSVNKIYNC